MKTSKRIKITLTEEVIDKYSQKAKIEKKPLEDILNKDINEILIHYNSIHESIWRMNAINWFLHEIKNPILSIRNSANSITNWLEIKNINKAKNAALNLVSSCDILSSVLQSMKIASEPIEEGQMTKISLNECVKDSLMEMRSFNKYSIKFEPSINLFVFAINRSLQQVFFNILKNSYESLINPNMTTNTNIVITAKEKAISDTDYAIIEIIDHGIGITQEIRDKIFSPYFTTKTGINRGLGLWVSKNIVESFNGLIEIESPIMKDFGTCVRIFLPKYKG